MRMNHICLNPLEAIPCIEIENLDTIDVKQFFQRAISLSENRSKKVIDIFNRKRRRLYGHIGLLPAEYASEYHKIKNEWQRKVITIGVDDDLVICVIKHIQMFQHIYKRLEGLPISLCNDKKNEELVFDKLSSNNLCKKFLVNEPESKVLDKKGYKLDTYFETYNYYSNVKTNYEKISTNKWRTKKGVNRLLKDEKLTWTKLDKPHNSIEKINNGFIRWKKDIEKSKWLSSGFAKSISQYEYWKDPNIDYWLFEYDNFPIGLIVYLTVNNDIGYQLVNKGIDHMIFDDTPDIPDEVRKRIGAYMHYITMKDLYDRGVQDTFAGGAMGTRKASLGVHKKIMNDSYFGVKIYENIA